MKMKYFTLLFFCSLFVGCSDETSTSFVNNQNQQARDTIDNEDDNSWVLIFADEFNIDGAVDSKKWNYTCLLYTSPSPRDGLLSRMPSSA